MYIYVYIFYPEFNIKQVNDIEFLRVFVINHKFFVRIFAEFIFAF